MYASAYRLKKWQYHASWVLNPVASILFGLALFTPLFTTRPGADYVSWGIQLISPGQAGSESYTLSEILLRLWSDGHHALAMLLAVLSVMLPLAKFTVIFVELICRELIPRILVRFMRVASRFAMVEIILIAILILHLKGLPGSSKVELESGFWFFTASVLIPLVTSTSRSRLFRNEACSGG